MSEILLLQPGVSTTDYIATGLEGNSVPMPGLFGRKILLLTYNTLVLIPETAGTLDAQGYYYDTNPASSTYQNLVFGFPLNTDDVIQIIST
jgi:hypothetical protein